MGRQSFSFARIQNSAGWIVAVVAIVLLLTGGPRIGISADAPATVAEGAAIAPVLSYQGRLLDPTTGVAKPDGIYEISFRLYNVASGGTPLWTESKDLPVSKGLFNTLLGDTTPLPTVPFNGQNLWLALKVGSDAEAAPRQRIAPTAYALYSDNADRLDGQDSVYYRNATNINTGTLADGRIAATLTRDGEVIGLVTANDGSGSGVDADLLDGQDSAYYRNATNINAGTLADGRVAGTLTRDSEVMGIVTANDGSGSTVDADTLDGIDSSGFFRGTSGVQLNSTINAGASVTWTSFGWSPNEMVLWWAVPRTEGGKLNVVVDTELEPCCGQGQGFIRYWITVRNTGTVNTNYDLVRYRFSQ